MTESRTLGFLSYKGFKPNSHTRTRTHTGEDIGRNLLFFPPLTDFVLKMSGSIISLIINVSYKNLCTKSHNLAIIRVHILTIYIDKSFVFLGNLYKYKNIFGLKQKCPEFSSKIPQSRKCLSPCMYLGHVTLWQIIF